MDETCGPVISECPERILKLLSPLDENDNSYAKDWRERCWKRIEKKKKLKGNHIFKTEPSIHFTDDNDYVFSIVDKNGNECKYTVYNKDSK